MATDDYKSLRELTDSQRAAIDALVSGPPTRRLPIALGSTVSPCPSGRLAIPVFRPSSIGAGRNSARSALLDSGIIDAAALDAVAGRAAMAEGAEFRSVMDSINGVDRTRTRADVEAELAAEFATTDDS